MIRIVNVSKERFVDLEVWKIVEVRKRGEDERGMVRCVLCGVRMFEVGLG